MLFFLRYFLLLGSLLGLTMQAQALSMQLLANKMLLTTDDYFILSVNIEPQAGDMTMDLYLSIQFPHGERYYFPNLEQIDPRNTVAALQSDWLPVEMQQQDLFDFKIYKEFPKGFYQWTLLAVSAGADVGDIRQWQAQTHLDIEIIDNNPKPKIQPFPNIFLQSNNDFSVNLHRNLILNNKQTFNNKQIIKPALPRNQQDTYFSSGIIDDNQNLSAFQYYVDGQIEQNEFLSLPKVNVLDRVEIKVLDNQQQAVLGAKINLFMQTNAEEELTNVTGVTAADGTFYFYPQLDELLGSTIQMTVSHSQSETVVKSQINLDEKPSEIVIDYPITVAKQPPQLDLMWVIDTTATLKDELYYINSQLHNIMANIQENMPDVDVRYGLRVYRDRGDDYVVRDFPFTKDLQQFISQLSDQKTRGGGDYPEALFQALDSALSAEWSSDNDVIKLLFLLTDAPAHENDLNTWLQLVNQARAQGVHIHSIAASETKDYTSYLLRTLSVLTQGRYLFVSDHDRGDLLQTEASVLCYPITALKHGIERVILSELRGQRQAIKPENLLGISGDFNQGVCQINAANEINPLAVEQ